MVINDSQSVVDRYLLLRFSFMLKRELILQDFSIKCIGKARKMAESQIRIFLDTTKTKINFSDSRGQI